MLQNIVIIGGGTMGTGIARLFAERKYHTALLVHSDTRIKKAQRLLTTHHTASNIIKNIHITTDFNICQTADLIIEAVSEKQAVKEAVLKKASHLARKDTLITSNTSSISLTQLSKVVQHKSRFLGMHFMNPAYKLPLVEITPARSTNTLAKNTILKLCTKLAKTTVVSRDRPGFIVNRILMPMINEAVLAYEEGVASQEDIDTAIHVGLLHPLGPLALADLIGLDVCRDILNVFYHELKNPKYRPAKTFNKLIRLGHLGRKTKQGFYKYK